jgi:hypothetical protein
MQTRANPGHVCEYDEKGECPETISINEVAQPCDAPTKDEIGTHSEKLTPKLEVPYLADL